MAFYLILSLFLVLVGHAFRLLRWEQFIRIYERPLRGQMLRGMAGGYALNFVLPFHLGDVFRAVFTGRRMKSGIGFALATVIMDRFLDVWFVALGFGAFWALGQGGAAVLGAAQYYLVFSLVLALGLVLVVALRDLLKKGCLAFCGLFNDTLKLDGMMFFWSLINTFKDLGRIKIGRLVVNTVLMWAAYLGSYTALAAALTAAGQPMALVDVFDLLFGRNAADLSALLPGGAMGAAAPAARILLLCWFALPLLAMWLVTLLPEKVRGAVNQATQAAPAGESYLNLLPQADPQDRAAFLSQYFGLQNKEWVKGFLKMNQGITIFRTIPPVPTPPPCSAWTQKRRSTVNMPLVRTAISWPNSWPGCAPSKTACPCATSCKAAPRTAAAGTTWSTTRRLLACSATCTPTLWRKAPPSCGRCWTRWKKSSTVPPPVRRIWKKSSSTSIKRWTPTCKNCGMPAPCGS